MSASVRPGLLAAVVLGTGLSAQIGTDLVEKRRSDFHTQATDADMKRDGGTQPRDWNYDLPVRRPASAHRAVGGPRQAIARVMARPGR